MTHLPFWFLLYRLVKIESRALSMGYHAIDWARARAHGRIVTNKESK